MKLSSAPPLFLKLLFIILIISPAAAKAADFTVGAAAWYANLKMDNSSSEYDPAILFGPVLSVQFSSTYTMSFVFLYGTFNDEQEGEETRKLHRYDSDLALNYRINSYLKIFAGAKYMRYNEDDMVNQSAGPALGIGLTLPIADNLFILGNASGLYTWGEEKDNDANFNVKWYGLNTSIMLAWYIPSASSTLSIGYRYQPIHYNTEDENDEDKTAEFYGITAAAAYSF